MNKRKAEKRMSVLCPECFEMHTVLSDYQEYNFGDVCDSCLDKSHERFLRDNPDIAAYMKV